MECNGLIERIEDKASGTVDYVRTQKGIELEEALNALGVWALRHINADIALCDTDVSTLMWQMRRWIVVEELPRRRVVIRFHFSDRNAAYNTYWMLIQPDTKPELCTSDPGLDIDLFIETTVTSLGGALTGRTNIAREVADGSLFLSGNSRLTKTIDRWLPGSSYAHVDGIAMLQHSYDQPAFKLGDDKPH